MSNSILESASTAGENTGAGTGRGTETSVVMSMQQALNRALGEVLAENPKALVFGEDCGRLGGVFRITDGLQAKYGADRVFDTPLAESGILGMSVGLAMAGFHPIPEVQFDASPTRPSIRSSARSPG
ncbi:3-methyl-2-oxobutanoate dehydrogenase subunit beta [Arthrobacter sp. Hiyo6]|nr:3-methyl-2-oxobutanoate dehydrogenase subunit beta [Arthrobacter sp. Hiyo6]